MPLSKRQDASYDCAQMGNQFPYCSPLTTDTWVNGSTHQFIWNFNYPFYVSSPTLDLTMYYIKNYQYTLIKNWTDMTTSDGELTVTVDDAWFPIPSYYGNKTWSLSLFYLPSGMNASTELQNTNSLYPRPYNFSVIQLPSPQPPSTTNNSTDPNHSNNNSSISNTPSSYSSNQHSGLPDWGIALIVLASVIVAAALGILAWAFLIYFPRKRRQRQHHMDDTKRSGAGPTPYSQQKQQEQKQQHHQQQRHQQEQLSSEKAESIYSDTPMIGGMVRSSVSIGGATTAPSSISQRHDSPSYPSIHQFTSLHSHDTINESLRQMIHRPDWTTTDEDIDEAKRRRLGEELLQRQLAEDGTMIKQTQPTRLKSMTSQIPKARTAIVVAESTESLSHSSSTTSLPSDHPPPR